MNIYISKDIPELLDFEKLRKTKGRKLNPYKLWYIISTVYLQRVMGYKIYGYDKNTFIPLKAKILSAVVGNYQTYLSKLLKWKILETDNHYVVGFKCRGYRLCEPYRNAKFELCRDDNDEIKVIKENVNKIKKFTDEYIENCLGSLDIDETGALEMAMTLDNLQEKDHVENIIKLVKNKETSHSSSPKTNRLFSVFTQLNKKFRKFITIDNCRAAMLDWTACQPCIVYSLNPDKNCAEGKKYKELLESGKFYEFFVNKLPEYFYSRNDVKEPLYMVWFGNDFEWENQPWAAATQALRDLFSVEFPEFWKIICKIKNNTLFYNEKNKKLSNGMASMLQKIESNLIFNKIIPWCKEQKILALTVHDSLAVKVENIEIVAAKMKEVFDEFTGTSNIISIEIL